jgi:hypothetical protein
MSHTYSIGCATANIDKHAAKKAAYKIIRDAQLDAKELVGDDNKDERNAAYNRMERAEEIAILCELTVDDHIAMSGRDCLWLLG